MSALLLSLSWCSSLAEIGRMVLSILSLNFLGWVIALGERDGSIDERVGIDQTSSSDASF